MESVTKDEYDQHKQKCGASFETITDQINRLNMAVYGDDRTNIGMAEQVKEMHQVFMSAGWAKKTIIGSFAAIGIIAGAILGIIELFRSLRR